METLQHLSEPATRNQHTTLPRNSPDSSSAPLASASSHYPSFAALPAPTSASSASRPFPPPPSVGWDSAPKCATKPSRPPLASKQSGSRSKRQVSNDASDGEGQAIERVAEGDGEGRIKRTRKRKPASCVRCRRKKLRCDRADPCDQCIAKGEEASCSWEGAEPLYARRNESDNQELRDQVARLESLVRYLTSQKNNDEAPRPSPSDSASPSSPELVDFPSLSRPLPHALKPSYAIDLRANDLCEGLAQLSVKEFVVVEGSGNDSWAPGHQRGLEFIDEARLFLRTMPQQFGVADGPSFSLPSSTASSSFGPRSRHSSEPQVPRSPVDSACSSAVSPNALGTSSFVGSNPPSVSELLKYLPTRERAHSAYRYFVDYVSWYSHPIHQTAFEEKWRQLDLALQLPDEEARDRAIDPFFIATFLGIIATGLSMMPTKRALRDGFPEDKDRIVDSWLEGAMLALTCGRFMDNPSVEAVNACVILSTFYVFTATGERVGAGMGLLSLVAQIALSLGLHRDPDRTPGRFTFFEAEQRRRLFWNLFMLCILSSASLGRTWSVFDLENTDCRLPLDCYDHEILEETTARAGLEKRKTKFAETPMTSLIVKMKLAILAKKMNARAFGINPIAYEEVLALDQDLKEFEEGIPERYRLKFDPSGALLRPTTHVTVTEMRACMIMISLTSEYIRLHRPWLLLSGTNKTFQYSRDQAIKYSKILLAVYRSPSCNKSRWGGLTYKAVSASTVLAIDVLAFPNQAEANLLRSTVRSTKKQMESQANVSSVCRKGSRLIEFLLERDALISAEKEERQHRQQKRTKVTDGTDQSFDGLREAFNTARPSEPIFMHERDEVKQEEEERDSLRRKGQLEMAALATEHPQPPSPSRTIAGIPPHAVPRSEPRARLDSPPSYAAPSRAREAVDFSHLAGVFDFDFSFPTTFPPTRPHLPSPALTDHSFAHQGRNPETLGPFTSATYSLPLSHTSASHAFVPATKVIPPHALYSTHRGGETERSEPPSSF